MSRPMWLLGARIVELQFTPGTDKLVAVTVEIGGQRARLEVTNVWNDLGQIVAGGALVPNAQRDGAVVRSEPDRIEPNKRQVDGGGADA